MDYAFAMVDADMRPCYSRRMKVSDAVRFAGTKAELARILGLSPQAVSKWADTLPPLQVYRLREKKPRWFAKLRREQAAAHTEAA